MEGKIKIGPAGDKNYKSPTMVNWDEGSHNGIISQIFLSHGSDGIYSIQFQFMLHDKSVLSDPHGQHTGSMFDVIFLNCPHEYITGISGAYSKYSGTPYIKTLKFATNTNVYGPFGNSRSYSDDTFIFKLGNFRQFGGFYGTYDATGLQNIGVYLQPTIVKPKTGTSNAEKTESKIVLF
ncbi:Jacalin-related lectin 2 [Cardamine amara subsp. amara]|uniref:Jacalin-related lectin 2 n=1 Tax=Cardamine amara subsp. amara TaxID=228776 RepID=A0ABD1AN83_CARAN